MPLRTALAAIVANVKTFPKFHLLTSLATLISAPFLLVILIDKLNGSKRFS